MAIGHLRNGAQAKRSTHTTFPLIVVTKNVMRVVAIRVGNDLRCWKKLDRVLEKHGPSIINCNQEIGAVVRTRPKTRVIVSTKWEVNITMKYNVASAAMVPRMVGILSLVAPDLDARKTINENASRSGCTRPPMG